MLKYFLTVAEEQNITKAAKKLHITQPTLSRQLRDFEESLKIDLFVRKNKRLYLTEAGLFLKKRAEEILTLDEKTEQEFINYQNAILNGQITIGCVEASNSHFLSKMLEEMIADHPHVSFDLFSGTSNDIIEKLDRGLLDIALLIEPVRLDEYNKLLLPEKEIWGVLVSTDYFLTSQDSVTSEDILGVPLIYSSRSEVQKMFLSWGGFRQEDLNIVGRYNLIFNVISLVENRVGVAVAIKGAVDNRNDHTKFLPFVPALETHCVLVWKKDAMLSPTTLKFLEKIENALKAYK